MKTAYCKLPFFIVLSALLLVACRKDVQLEHKTPSVKETKMEAMTTTACFEWTVDYPGAMRSVVKLSQKEDMSNATSIGNDSISTYKVFSATASDLTIGTKYYYCYYTWNPMVEYTSEVRSFTTNGPSVPTVTASVTNIINHSVIGVGKVVDDGNATVTKRGFCWSKSHNPTTSNSHISDGTGTGVGQFTVQINGLEESTTYYLRAYAVNSKGTGYSEEVSFTTLKSPVVTTAELTDISCNAAVCGGTVTDDGGFAGTARGICWSTDPNPTIADLHTNDGMGLGNFVSTMTGLTLNTTYYVRAYVQNSYVTAYGNQRSFTTEALGVSSGSIGGHDYVDLGLPSGLLWATCNVGAGTPEDYGDYFAWCETQPKDHYGEDNYQFTDNPAVLLPEDDAATANWGSGWRMPTYDDWVELCENTTHIWTTQNGVNGLLFTGNCNILFLPAAGSRYGSSLGSAGSLGYYWSSSLDTDSPYNAWRLFFDSGGCGMDDGSRYYGRSVRPVRSGQN